ncbi:MAG TPA: ABC transporter permease [Candidatus Binataceae bacterium]|nr:ABC transporter permease [Candidatus Binataceae bacterium]
MTARNNRHFPPTAGSRTALFSIAAGIALMFLVGPLVKLVATSNPAGLANAFVDRDVMSAIGVSVLAATWATAIGAVLGLPLGFVLARHEFAGKSIVEGLIDLPIVIPHPIAGIALLFVFGRGFFVGHAFSMVGIHFAGATAGIVIAMLFVSAPFLINAARDGFRAVDPRLEGAARTLGRGPWSVFASVTMPLARPALISGAVMMWARALSEFGAVVVLAYYPMTAPVLIYDRFEGYGLKAAQPVAAVVVIVALAIFAILRWLSRREQLA